MSSCTVNHILNVLPLLGLRYYLNFSLFLGVNNPSLINYVLRSPPGAKSKTRFSNLGGCIRDQLTSRAHHSNSAFITCCAAKVFPRRCLHTYLTWASSLCHPLHKPHVCLSSAPWPAVSSWKQHSGMEYHTASMLCYVNQLAVTASSHVFSGTTSLHDFMPLRKPGELILWSRDTSKPICIQSDWIPPDPSPS